VRELARRLCSPTGPLPVPPNPYRPGDVLGCACPGGARRRPRVRAFSPLVSSAVKELGSRITDQPEARPSAPVFQSGPVVAGADLELSCLGSSRARLFCSGRCRPARVEPAPGGGRTSCPHVGPGGRGCTAWSTRRGRSPGTFRRPGFVPSVLVASGCTGNGTAGRRRCRRRAAAVSGPVWRRVAPGLYTGGAQAWRTWGAVVGA